MTRDDILALDGPALGEALAKIDGVFPLQENVREWLPWTNDADAMPLLRLLIEKHFIVEFWPYSLFAHKLGKKETEIRIRYDKNINIALCRLVLLCLGATHV